MTGVLGAQQYTWSWSTTDTTEDISGLSAGTYTVTATDCNGCTATGSYTVSGLITGCMDSTASNYNALAVCPDSSACVYISMCCNTAQYGAGTAPSVVGVPATISTCNYLSEYSPISGVCAGGSYTLSVTGANANPGWITVYSGSSCGTLVAEGPSPLTWTAVVGGTHYAHWHADNACTTAGGCHTTSITYNGGAVSGCTNPLAVNYNEAACVDAGEEWDWNLCNSGACDLPVMGDEGVDFTEGYMNTGDFPTFKIYDASEDSYYDAAPSNDETWANMALYIITNLNGVIFGCTDPIACNYIAEATMDDGSCLENDCTGDCGGSIVLDECGVCGGEGHEENFDYYDN